MTGFVVVIREGEEGQIIEEMNKATREWTAQAARGECGWTCADCCMGFSDGMPDECAHGHQRCTEIIQRDKAQAMRVGNEPF